MYIHLPWYYWFAILAANAGVAAFLIGSIGRGLRFAAGAVIIGWFAAVLLLSAQGLFQYNKAYAFPYFPIAIVAPLAAGPLLFRLSAALRSAAYAVPLHRLIGIQALRTLGFLFLLLLAQHRLPAIFALPAGVGDMLVGATAIVVARRVRANGVSAANSAIFWNICGILDLVAALSIGFLSSTSPLRMIFTNPATDVMTMLPMVLIPAFGVPLFLLLHTLTLGRLLSRNAAKKLTMQAA